MDKLFDELIKQETELREFLAEIEKMKLKGVQILGVSMLIKFQEIEILVRQSMTTLLKVKEAHIDENPF